MRRDLYSWPLGGRDCLVAIKDFTDHVDGKGVRAPPRPRLSWDHRRPRRPGTSRRCLSRPLELLLAAGTDEETVRPRQAKDP